ncbi:MAG: aminopeptidase P family protein [Methanomassiliicoccales archaeon]
MRERALRIFSHAPPGLDAIVLANDVEPNLDLSFFYAVDVESGLFEQCYVIIWPDGSTDLFTSALEETSARSSRSRLHVFQSKAERLEMLKEALRGAKRIGVSGAGLTFRMLNELKSVCDAEIVDVWKAIEAARLVKDQKEIERLRHACRIASLVGQEIPSIITEGMKEYEAAAEVSYRMVRRGAAATAFQTNASFGPNSAEPHHSPTSDQLREGDVALFDFGALYKRYGSDVTRTFFFGRADEEQREMYQVVLEAQSAALNIIREGVSAKEVDAAARKVIDSSRFKNLMVHSVGHGIGLSVHDGGRLSPESELILKENMVFTVEPGIYIKGKGGVRIEDDVIVTKDGCEILTFCSKELLVI